MNARKFGMGTARLAATGGADPATAWERYARPALWSSWAPQIRGVRTDVDRLRTGASGTVLGPVGVRVKFVVTDFDEVARTWSWTARLGPIRMKLTHAVEDFGDGGARTTLISEGPWPVLAGYIPLARWAISRLVSTE